MGAISVLEKGLGFVPTPELDVMDNRLDMRLTVNRILSSSKSNLKQTPRKTTITALTPLKTYQRIRCSLKNCFTRTIISTYQAKTVK